MLALSNNNAVTAVTLVDTDRISAAITIWLDSIAARSGSVRSVQAYSATISEFRTALRGVGIDLDGDPYAISIAAQRWVWQGRRGTVSAATASQRLTILSSFYAFVLKRRLLPLTANPIDMVDRPKTQQYAKSRALDVDTVRQALSVLRANAETGDVMAMRDLAFLRIALTTGRRLSELAGLCWGDISVTARAVTIQWRAKGGKLVRDTLASDVARDLLKYVTVVYGTALATLAKNAPIWVRKDGAALTAQACGDIIRRWLHVNPHTTRHTFAHSMRRAGASDSVIQARLGHSSLATTGRYLAALDSASNPYVDKLAAMFG